MAQSVTIAGVEISRPGKVLYPAVGASADITKADVAEYYATVAHRMLPHLASRPVSMQRFPDGIEAGGFYEKQRPDHFPDWVHAVSVDTGEGRQQHVVVDGRRALVYLAGQACLTMHPWLSRTADDGAGLDRPDRMIFDLDPSVDDLSLVRRATRAVGDELESLGLRPFLKTTGSRGYHVVVPIRPEHSFDTVRGIARMVADRVVAGDPDAFTTEVRKDKRGRRVFIDVLRNAYGQTAVAPYALRARPGAPVATPIEWDELSRVAPDEFTMATARERAEEGTVPWKGLGRHARALTTTMEDMDCGGVDCGARTR